MATASPDDSENNKPSSCVHTARPFRGLDLIRPHRQHARQTWQFVFKNSFLRLRSNLATAHRPHYPFLRNVRDIAHLDASLRCPQMYDRHKELKAIVRTRTGPGGPGWRRCEGPADRWNSRNRRGMLLTGASAAHGDLVRSSVQGAVSGMAPTQPSPSRLHR
jgi:hypothetical protein